MANRIKIKRGPSSNIATADLQQGELAITTDTNELYTNDGTKNVKITPSMENYPTVYSGTSAPSSSLGKVGDLYILLDS